MSTAVEKTAFVEALPRRTAHAVHALIEAGVEHVMPVTAAEICLFDSEAISVVATGAALREARKRELAVFTGRYWLASFDALDHRQAFEDRYLRETAQEGDS